MRSNDLLLSALVLVAVGLWGCQNPTTPSAGETSESVAGYDMILWYKMPPVDRVSHGALIPILKIGGAYYTVSHGLEIPLKECPEGLQWNLTPSTMSETTIGFFGPDRPCSIRIVDRQRASFDDFYLPDKMPPVPMTEVDKPPELLDTTARHPRTLDDFLGVYQPTWLPWVRMEIRKDAGRYWTVEHNLDSPEPPLVWKARGEPREITPLSDRLGFDTGSSKNPKQFTYNEALKRFEIVLTNSGVKMPLARVSPSSGTDAALPPLPIGIPAWH